MKLDWIDPMILEHVFRNQYSMDFSNDLTWIVGNVINKIGFGRDNHF